MASAEFLAELQATLAREGGTWTAGVTSFSQLTEDQQRLRLGYIPGPGEMSMEQREMASRRNLEEFMARTAASESPGNQGSINWTNVKGSSYVTPVKNQGDCGSCVAFAVAATLESVSRVQTSRPMSAAHGVSLPDLSEAQLFYCYGAKDGAQCKSGWHISAAMSYCQSDGVAPSAFFPYTASDQICALKDGWQQYRTQISGHTELSDMDSMKQSLEHSGPLATCFAVYEDFGHYTKGVYRHTSGKLLGYHAVCCIGYDDVQQAWLCKNSWGTDWGEGGLFWIGYGQCGIDAEMYQVDAIAEYPRKGTLCCGTFNGTVYARPTELDPWVKIADSGNVRALAIMKDGTLLGVGMWDGLLYQRASLFGTWAKAANNSLQIGDVTVMQDGTILACGSADGLLYVRSDPSATWSAVAGSGTAYHVTILPNGMILAAGNRVLMTRETLTSPWVTTPSVPVYGLSCMPDGTVLAIIGNYSLVQKPPNTNTWIPVPDGDSVLGILATG